MIDNGYLKLQKYWNKHVSRPSIYVAAIVLDPSQKWTYFADWDAYWVDQARALMKTLWESVYRPSDGAAAARISTTKPTTAFGKWMQARKAVSNDIDELERYLLEPTTVDVDDIIAWWRD